MLLSSNAQHHALRSSVLLAVLLFAAACSDDANTPADGGAGQAGGNAGNAGNAGQAGNTAGSGGTAGNTGGVGGHLGDGPAPVLLGTAGRYVILAKSEVSNIPTSAITGDIGLSPAAASYITGFTLTRAGTRWTAPEVTGDLFASDNDAPTPSNLTTAVADMEAAYTDAAGRPSPTALNLGAGMIGGMTLMPGLYNWNSSVTIPTNLTLAGAANDVWIFQVSGDLSIAAATRVTLSGGAQPKNIFWQVAGTVDLGTSAHMEGIVLTQTAATVGSGASLNGRLLAQTAVTLSAATITQPAE